MMPKPVALLIEVKDGHVKDANFGMVTALRADGRALTALVVDAAADPAKKALEPFGVNRIVSIRSGAGPEQWATPLKAEAVAMALAHFNIDTLVGLSSGEGRDLLPRIAARLDAPLVMDCTHFDPEAHLATTSQYSGKTLATVSMSGRFHIYGLRPNVFAAEHHPSIAEIIDFKASPPDPAPYRLLAHHNSDTGGPHLSEACVIISGGRGLENNENFNLLTACARLMGACVGASRAAVDNGWVPYSMQVGQTGAKVNPDVYLAVGISGSVQHFAGMKTAKTIIAINTDPKAPIIAQCDYYAVRDLFEVLPELQKALAARRSKLPVPK